MKFDWVRSRDWKTLTLMTLCAMLLGVGCAPEAPPEPSATVSSEDSGGDSSEDPVRIQKVVLDGLGRLPAFSHASIVGDLVFVSGTLGTSGETLGLVEGGIGPQTIQTLRNIERILEGVGSSLDRVAKCNVYVTDMAEFAQMNEAYLSVFGDDPPARTTVGVNELALGAAVEIECIGAVGQGQ